MFEHSFEMGLKHATFCIVRHVMKVKEFMLEIFAMLQL